MITKYIDAKPVFDAETGKLTGTAEHREFVCTTAEDVPDLPGAEVCLPGSIAWVVATGEFYGFDGTNWIKQG